MGDLEIVKRAIAGDDESFLLVMQVNKEGLYRTAFAFLRNEHDALEAMQEVIYRAYKNMHKVKEPSYVKTWLTRIMMNYCQDQLKKKKRFTINETLNEISIDDGTVQLELQEALKKLSEQEQQLVYMKYFQDTKIKDIAVMENIPEGTVKSRLHKILKTLRQHLTEKGEMDHV
ncbi:sigma-70 family RNA polymerase sigma factor [Paenisporosarcina quisquiliarum]|uniref:Sigma-70 family RNA polymerase sigma factor n=1 Tax=Paenisporosarcina quisquiliarum TaxID=365346 RepID=A0A9X3LGV5_9BACL|nr:sigma-70 family RNA polymerase sigma factor [Paenisporosarcina quisquiliarum]MCZ8537462.1 sigma-70 family RNA polymerase sigma factor [Paenisporosarcina quisquiliarum]